MLRGFRLLRALSLGGFRVLRPGLLRVQGLEGMWGS